MHIQNSSEILDLACGRGGFTDLIAQNTKGNVLGVDISEAQLAHARSHQRKNLEFIACDIMHVNKLQRKFDAVSFLDAACYLPDKRKAIKKIANVVNPNGRFLLVDWCMRSGLSRMQEKIVLHPFMRFWAVPNLETQENYETYLQRYGFRVIDSSVLNDAARPNWEIGYKNAIKAVQELSFKDIYGLMTKGAGLKEGLRIISEQFPAALYIKAGFDSGFLQYVHILAEKSKS